MDHAAVPQVAQIAGALFGALFALGCIIFFALALTKAINTRSGGWIAATVLSGLPLLALVIFFAVTFVIGFNKGFTKARETAAARRASPTELLSAPMAPVTGKYLPYELSIPNLEAWHLTDNHDPFDQFLSFRDRYVGIVAEGIGMSTPSAICDASQSNLKSKASECAFTEPKPITIDGQSWLTFDATAKIKTVHIKYRFYVYANNDYTFQVICWTGTAMFADSTPLFDRIAKSFKLPKAKT